MVAPLTFFLAYCSITYEFLIARVLTQLTDSPVLSYCFTIGVYLTALGVGTYLADYLKPTQKNARVFLSRVEYGLSALGAICVPLILFVDIFYRIWVQAEDAGSTPLVYFYAWAGGVVFLVGVLSGFEIPFLTDMGKVSEPKVLAYNYFGTLIGTLVFVFLFLNQSNLIFVGVVVAVLNWGVAFLLDKKILATLSLIPIALVAYFQNDIDQFHLKNLYYNQVYLGKPVPFSGLREFLKDKPLIRSWSSPYQRIDRVEQVDESAVKGEYSIFINSHFQFNNIYEATYHETIAHIPIQVFNKIPKNILVLGGGDGLITRELLKYGDRVSRITQVDIDPIMLELARTEFRSSNLGSLDHPKVKLIQGDAFYFLRNTTEKFDGIFIDVPYPNSFDLVKLYSVEFYRFVSKALAQGGVLGLDCPLGPTNDQANNYHDQLYINSVVFSSLKAAGFNSFFGYERGDTFLVASREENFSFDFTFKDFGIELKALKPKDVANLWDDQVPYELKDSLVNSIFSPKLLRLGRASY